MKFKAKELLLNQAEWQQTRKTASWGDKIRQAERARETLGSYCYRENGTSKRLLSLREEDNFIYINIISSL